MVSYQTRTDHIFQSTSPCPPRTPDQTRPGQSYYYQRLWPLDVHLVPLSPCSTTYWIEGLHLHCAALAQVTDTCTALFWVPGPDPLLANSSPVSSGRCSVLAFRLPSYMLRCGHHSLSGSYCSPCLPGTSIHTGYLALEPILPRQTAAGPISAFDEQRIVPLSSTTGLPPGESTRLQVVLCPAQDPLIIPGRKVLEPYITAAVLLRASAGARQINYVSS